jgi:hypothetical protein
MAVHVMLDNVLEVIAGEHAIALWLDKVAATHSPTMLMRLDLTIVSILFPPTYFPY